MDVSRADSGEGAFVPPDVGCPYQACSLEPKTVTLHVLPWGELGIQMGLPRRPFWLCSDAPPIVAGQAGVADGGFAI